MRKIVALTPALLAACSTAPAAPADPPVHGETPGHTCTEEGTSQFIGQTRSDAVGAEIKRVSNAAVLRWAPPGVMLTMDYRADRVTVWLDSANKIFKIRCG
ncbi:I78 family peptidase inhibitor [Sphingomonas segetis]|jgi:hypothetical protein|uniref:I78 family peptidase inhibitor n=1 Tax=Sphingomonas segetis TaxID=1104779 RepID=UPI0012D2B074|nr:I78 family peptidase inhibitor [Sphingomonas segetis]